MLCEICWKDYPVLSKIVVADKGFFGWSTWREIMVCPTDWNLKFHQ